MSIILPTGMFECRVCHQIKAVDDMHKYISSSTPSNICSGDGFLIATNRYYKMAMKMQNRGKK